MEAPGFEQIVGHLTCTATGWEPMEARREPFRNVGKELVRLPGGNQWKLDQL